MSSRRRRLATKTMYLYLIEAPRTARCRRTRRPCGRESLESIDPWVSRRSQAKKERSWVRDIEVDGSRPADAHSCKLRRCNVLPSHLSVVKANISLWVRKAPLNGSKPQLQPAHSPPRRRAGRATASRLVVASNHPAMCRWSGRCRRAGTIRCPAKSSLTSRISSHSPAPSVQPLRTSTALPVRLQHRSVASARDARALPDQD